MDRKTQPTRRTGDAPARKKRLLTNNPPPLGVPAVPTVALKGGRTDGCPITTLDKLRHDAFKHVRFNKNKWVGTALVPLEDEHLHPVVPKRLKLGRNVWMKIRTPKVLLRVGLAFDDGEKSNRASIHLHGNLETEAGTLHLDYFKFMSWGPLRGVEGFIASLDGTVLGAGGNWGQPPGGGNRNWPLSVAVGPDHLLTIYDGVEKEGDAFVPKNIALWRKMSDKKK